MTLSNDNGMSQHDADAVGDSPDYSPTGYIAELVEGIVAMADETDGGKLDARAHCEDLIRAVRADLSHVPMPAAETPTVDKTVERLNMLHRSMGNVRSVLDRVQSCRTPDHDAQDRMVGDWQEQVILAIGELTEPQFAGHAPASETPSGTKL